MTDLHALDHLRGHSLVPTDEELAAIPSLYSTDTMAFESKTIFLRYFAGGSAEWLVAEVDPEQWLFFGFCDLGLGYPEWGYASLQEMCAVRARSPQGFPIYVERDLHWEPKTFGTYQAESGQ